MTSIRRPDFDDLACGRGSTDGRPLVRLPSRTGFPAEFIFLDTPGLSTLIEERTEVTLGELPFVDAAVICVDIRKGGLTSTVTEFLQSPKRKGADQTDQTDRLLNYACKNGWLPLFCFYNSCHPKLDSPLWGCAIASAHSVSKLLSSGVSKANYIEKIKPKSVPWMCLVCPELPIPQKNFPEAIRSRAMDNIPEIGTVPEVVHDLPEYVRQLLNMASNEDSLELPHEESLLTGIVVVSDQPIERQD